MGVGPVCTSTFGLLSPRQGRPAPSFCSEHSVREGSNALSEADMCPCQHVTLFGKLAQTQNILVPAQFAHGRSRNFRCPRSRAGRPHYYTNSHTVYGVLEYVQEETLRNGTRLKKKRGSSASTVPLTEGPHAPRCTVTVRWNMMLRGPRGIPGYDDIPSASCSSAPILYLEVQYMQ